MPDNINQLGFFMTANFAGFAADLAYSEIPEDVLWVLRRSFTDTMGVAAIGSTTGMSEIARIGALAVFGVGTVGGAKMLMDGRFVSPAGAAMAGAFTIDSIDAHDGTSPCKGHAGSAIFPALIAMVQAEIAKGRAIDGKCFAELLAVSYEISYRAGMVQHATCADYHTSGAWTAVGVAVGGTKLLGGGCDQIRHAAGIGEYHGPRSQMMRCIDYPTMVRDGVGWGAPSGVTASYLAMEGFTGAPALTCEGEEGAIVWADLGSGWRIADHTHYKAYPCCRWAHPSLDAVADLMHDNALTHYMIEAVEIRTFHNATRLAGHEPQTLDDFSYAIAFPVAAMIVRGQLGLGELAPDVLEDKDILRISRATRLIDDDHYTKISTEKRWAEVTIELKDGRRFNSGPRSPRGDVDLPLGDGEIATKYHQFADAVLGEERAAEIERLSGRFDTLDAPGLQRLLALCTDAV